MNVNPTLIRAVLVAALVAPGRVKTYDRCARVLREALAKQRKPCHEVNAMKLFNVLDVVKKELIARLRSVEDSATYGITEIMATKYKVTTEDGTLVIVRIPEPRRFLKDPTGYLLQAEWSSVEGFPLEISVNQDEILLKPRSTAQTS